MDVEVDRMKSLALKPEALTSELQVVGEERRWRVDNNPVSLLRETMMDSLYSEHPYHWPVIGYMKDIQAYTVEKLRHFYETFYVPNNAVLVITGDFNPEKTKALLQKYYGSLVAKPIPERHLTAEPERTKPVHLETKSEVQNTTVMVAFKTVPVGDPDQYPLDLLANILGAGTSSRLYKKLVYQMQEATSVGADSETNADPGYFSLHAGLQPKHTSKKAESIFQEEIHRVQQNPISAAEIEKSKNQIMKDFVEGLSTIDGRAQTLAVTEILRGDYHSLFDDLKKYQAVTAADLQRVAKKYLQPQRMVTAVLSPAPVKGVTK